MAEQAILEVDPKAKKAKPEVESQESMKVIWRSNMRKLHIPIALENGKTVYVKFDNHRLDLDMSDKTEKMIHEHLEKSSAYKKNDIDLVVNQGIRKDVMDRAERFAKLMSKDPAELRQMLTSQELRDLGLPVNCNKKAVLIMAIQEHGKFK